MEEIKAYGEIYCITNNVNGKVYIGQTTNYIKRVRAYKRLRCKGQTKLYNALKKYGFENFSFEVIDRAMTKDVLDFLEAFYIETIDSRNDDIGYNLKMGGSYGKHSEESKKKMSETQKVIMSSEGKRKHLSEKNKGHVVTGEARKNMSKAGKGRIFSDDHKAKISEASKGKVISEEAKKKMRIAWIARRARGVSQETREKISKANIGRVMSIDNKRKLIEANTGSKKTEETKGKISNSLKGKLLSEDHKKKISEKGKEVWDKKRKLKELQLST